MSPRSADADHAFVVPAYGDSPFLAACLASLGAQTVKSRAVITTSSPSAFVDAAAAAHGLKVLVNPERAGIAADWTFALRRGGEFLGARYVTLAHQDDTYGADFVAETLAAFGRTPGVLCFTAYQEIDDAGAPKSSKISRAKHLIEAVTLGRARSARGLRLRLYLSFGNPLPCSSVTFDLTKLDDFAFSSAYAANLDWDAWWRLMTSGAVFARAPGRLVGRRHNPLTATAGLLADGTRRREDQVMFRRAWPRPLADLIAWAYRAGY